MIHTFLPNIIVYNKYPKFGIVVTQLFTFKVNAKRTHAYKKQIYNILRAIFPQSRPMFGCQPALKSSTLMLVDPVFKCFSFLHFFPVFSHFWLTKMFKRQKIWFWPANRAVWNAQKLHLGFVKCATLGIYRIGIKLRIEKWKLQISRSVEIFFLGEKSISNLKIWSSLHWLILLSNCLFSYNRVYWADLLLSIGDIIVSQKSSNGEWK